MEAGLSDFHKVTVIILETKFERLKPKIIHYRNYKRFLNDRFENFGLGNLSTTYNGLEKFLQVYTDAQEDLAPRKKKYTKGNNIPFMNKSLTCAHMKRIQLRNKFLKNRSESNRLPSRQLHVQS